MIEIIGQVSAAALVGTLIGFPATVLGFAWFAGRERVQMARLARPVTELKLCPDCDALPDDPCHPFCLAWADAQFACDGCGAEPGEECTPDCLSYVSPGGQES